MDDADLSNNVDFFRFNPFVQLVAGKARVTGQGTCESDSGPTAEEVITIEQVVNGILVAGTGVASIACTGTSQNFTVDIGPTNPHAMTEATGWSTDNVGSLSGNQIGTTVQAPVTVAGNALALYGWQ